MCMRCIRKSYHQMETYNRSSVRSIIISLALSLFLFPQIMLFSLKSSSKRLVEQADSLTSKRLSPMIWLTLDILSQPVQKEEPKSSLTIEDPANVLLSEHHKFLRLYVKELIMDSCHISSSTRNQRIAQYIHSNHHPDSNGLVFDE